MSVVYSEAVETEVESEFPGATEATADTEEHTIVQPIRRRKPRTVGKVEEDTSSLDGPVRAAGTSTFPVPTSDQFGSHEYMTDPKLDDLAHKLIESHPSLAHLSGMSVVYYWKKKGGTSSGMSVQGKCIKPGGLVWHLCEADYIVWLAADACVGFSRTQVEALLLHELLHTGRDEKGDRCLVGHDVEEFAEVIREFGLINPRYRVVARAFRQLKLEEAD